MSLDALTNVCEALDDPSISLKIKIFYSFQAFSILNRSISINDNSSLTCSTNLHLFTGMENLQGVPKKVLFRKIAKPLIK